MVERMMEKRILCCANLQGRGACVLVLKMSTRNLIFCFVLFSPKLKKPRSNWDDVQAALNRVQAAARGVSMIINATKTKVMQSLIDPVDWQPLILDGVNLEDVQSFVYLGSTIMLSGQGSVEVDRRIGAARSAFVRLKRTLWGRQEIYTATKRRIYQAIVQTILLYGCKTWPLRAVDLRKLEVFDNDCLRYILHRRMNFRPLPPVLLQRRLRWFGHAAQRPEEDLIRDVVLPRSLPNWRKRVGGKLNVWANSIEDDLAALSGPQQSDFRRWNLDWHAISCDLAQE